LLIALKQVAWTPIAERYLYLPSTFYVVGLSVLIQSSWEKFRRPVILITLFVLAMFACASLQRSMLWNDKLAFFEDAVAKSPEFGSVHYSLGGELMGTGDINGAAQAFNAADRLNKRDSMRYPIKASIMGTMIANGFNQEANRLFYQLFKDKKQAPSDFLELLYKADSKRINMLSGNDKSLLAVDLLDTLNLLNHKHNDPFWLYRSGQIALIIGDRVKATDFFSRAYKAAPTDAHYRQAAGIYLRKLGHAQ
jgi:tetratricopeptide (TPR) repeat protein